MSHLNLVWWTDPDIHRVEFVAIVGDVDRFVADTSSAPRSEFSFVPMTVGAWIDVTSKLPSPLVVHDLALERHLIAHRLHAYLVGLVSRSEALAPGHSLGERMLGAAAALRNAAAGVARAAAEIGAFAPGPEDFARLRALATSLTRTTAEEREILSRLLTAYDEAP